MMLTVPIEGNPVVGAWVELKNELVKGAKALQADMYLDGGDWKGYHGMIMTLAPATSPFKRLFSSSSCWSQRSSLTPRWAYVIFQA
jgi:hypothetical protein